MCWFGCNNRWNNGCNGWNNGCGGGCGRCNNNGCGGRNSFREGFRQGYWQGYNDALWNRGGCGGGCGGVQGVAHVEAAVGERRAVVKGEAGLALILLQQLVVEVHVLPALEHLRLPLGQTRPHGEVGLGQIDGLVVIHDASPFIFVSLIFCFYRSYCSGTQPVGSLGRS